MSAPSVFLGCTPVSHVAAGARMVARAIAQGSAIDLRQAADHQQLVAERLQRLQDGREREARAFHGRRPSSA